MTTREPTQSAQSPSRSQQLTIQQNLDLAVKLHSARRLPEAEALYKQILQQNPHHHDALHLLGLIAQQSGKSDRAVELISQALNIKPDFAVAHCNLGAAHRSLGRLAQAEANFRKAIALQPDFAAAHNNLGNALKEHGKLDEAVASFHKAIVLQPDSAETYSNLGSTFKEFGKMDEAVASYNKALALNPNYAEAHSYLLLCFQYHPDMDASRLRQEHERWWEVHGKCLPRLNKNDDLDLEFERPLRIGMVSPDFRQHPVGYLTMPLFENVNHQNVQLFCYSDGAIEDSFTQRFVDAAYQWTRITGISDDDLASTLR